MQANYSYPIDIWSLGCAVFEVATGKVLFRLSVGNVEEKVLVSASRGRALIDVVGRIVSKCRTVISWWARSLTGCCAKHSAPQYLLTAKADCARSRRAPSH